MIRSYKDLQVYKRSYKLALKVHEITLKFPDIEKHELGSQLRRATKSIPLNIGEGYGKRSSENEFKRFLMMAIGSCDEVKILIEFAKDLNYCILFLASCFLSGRGAFYLRRSRTERYGGADRRENAGMSKREKR